MSKANKMSVFQLTILTAVNMMGSGIIMLPSKLAQVGALSIVSWLVTAVGSMALAYVFAKCGMYSKKGGGMSGYAEYSFGKAGNFLANYTMESACANADAVDNPEKNVPKAVLGGTLLAAACYIVSTNIIFGIVPADVLVSSSAPFGLVFSQMFGGTVGKIIMGLMVLSCFGSLLGWQFTIANVFKAGSDEGYFPAFLKKVTSHGAPIAGMVAITIIQSLFSLMTISPSLNEQFETLVNLAVITNIMPYLLCMASVVVIMKAVDHVGSELKTTKLIAFIASLYSLYACYASGFEAMTYGAIVTVFGWTLYGFVSDRFDLKKAKADNEAMVSDKAPADAVPAAAEK
jgi:putrescine:ornithine antiporter